MRYFTLLFKTFFKIHYVGTSQLRLGTFQEFNWHMCLVADCIGYAVLDLLS